MKVNRKEAKWLLILVFHVTSVRVEASESEALRVLTVGLGGSSRFSAADLLSGRKASGQQHREIVKTPVMTDEARPMMLVTGPNLCEDDTDRQSFTTALLLSSPGPHAVLMLLHLEDQPSGQCDLVQQAQELLGAQVLQYCIVVLIQNQQERLTGASRGIAGPMIRACGGRFHIISDSQPKPAALVEEIHKLVWINGGQFYSPLNMTLQLQSERLELLKRLKEIDDKLEKYELSSKPYNTLGVVGWSLIMSLVAVFLANKQKVKMLIFEATLAGLVMFMVSLRNALDPHVAFILNLSLCSTVVAAFVKHLPKLGNTDYHGFVFTVGLGLTLGSVAGIRTFSDVFTACCAGVGATIGVFGFMTLSFELKTIHVRELFLLLMFCAVAAELAVLSVIVVTGLFGAMPTIILTTIGIVIAINSQPNVENAVNELFPPFVFFPCGCVFIASVVLIFDILLSYITLCVEFLINSYLFYPALLFACLMLIGSSRFIPGP